MTEPLRQANIQGNILSGFNKDHQSFLFVNFPAPASGKAWLAALASSVASTQEVVAFNVLYKEVTARRGEEGTVKSTWINVAISASGLQALGIAEADLDAFPDAFKAGMAARAEEIGDTGPSAPGGWVAPFGPGDADIHAVLLLASDEASDLDDVLLRQIDLMSGHDVRLLFKQDGHARTDLPGHEHFGFKDGISQPGVRGFTAEGAQPNQGQPGQELLWPGEFVLGYPKQKPHLNPKPIPGPPDYGGATPPEVSSSEPETEAGEIAASGPGWTADGSYLVFRRLRQDVAAFDAAIERNAQSRGMAAGLLGAKLVGRYKGGCPLEHTADEPSNVDPQAEDPSIADPSVLEEAKINNFRYGSDPEGTLVPRAAHIRKVYPRDEPTPGGGQADTETHRLLRRGIAYGEPYELGAPSGSPQAGDAAFPQDRGLLFLCYQASLEDQFEFVQKLWVNNFNFPQKEDGQDPIVSQEASQRQFHIPGVDEPTLGLPQFVITTGGEYFFAPSISALETLGSA